MRTIQSPGVEIREIDQTLRPVLPTGTSVVVAGFADRGPTDEILTVTSQSEFEQIYGLPTTPAERYFYHTVRPLFQSPANVSVYRLPYGTDTGDGFTNNYSVLAYPASAVSIEADTYGEVLSTYSNDTKTMYLIGKPTHFTLSKEQYNDILQNNNFNWSDQTTTNFATSADLGKAAFIVLNRGQTTIDQKFQGYYIGAIDNTNQNPATDFDGVIKTLTITQSAISTVNYSSIPRQRLDFSLSALSDNTNYQDDFWVEEGSISQQLENLTQFSLDGSKFNDTISLGVFKLRASPFVPETIKLTQVLEESYVGSLDYHRTIQSQQGGPPVSFRLDIEDGESPNVTIMTNDYVSQRNGASWLDSEGLPKNIVRFTSTKFADATNAATNAQLLSAEYVVPTASLSGQSTYVSTLSSLLNEATTTLGTADALFSLGVYANTDIKKKPLGSIPKKLDRMFEKIENVDLFDIDITVDGGLSTIHSTIQETGEEYFDDTVSIGSTLEGLYKSNINDITGAAKTFRGNWNTVFARFADFAEKRRKDHMFVADLPRQIFVQGFNNTTLSDNTKNFSLHVLKPMQAITSIANTSYAATYGQWVKVYDSVLDKQIWVPISGFVAATMASSDANTQPWFAPAGFSRGILQGVNELAINPRQKQRDSMYKISINPVPFLPGEGYVIFGQKTLLKQPSAFDRINVRRLFLYLEKATRKTVKFFVFEPNSLFTRTRIVNTLNPIFNNAKNTDGVYDYLLVCDERNNTPDIIDQNELVVDIYLKPVRAAEFILVNFYATRTSADFNEIIA